jgi:hypothetical protein
MLIAGYAVSLLGYYSPFMVAGCVLLSIGTGLLTTISAFTSRGKWIGCQILIGIGAGICWQQPLIAVQATLKPEQISIGIATIIFSQTLGSTLFISVAQNVFADKIRASLGTVSGNDNNTNIPINSGGGTDTSSSLDSQDLITAYNHALTQTFFIPVGLSTSLIIGALGVKWTSIKTKGPTSKIDCTQSQAN